MCAICLLTAGRMVETAPGKAAAVVECVSEIADG